MDAPFYERPKFWRGVVFWGLFALFILAYKNDIAPALRGWWDLISIILRRTPPPLDASLAFSMVKLAMNVIIYVFFFLLSTFIVAQFVLPVQTWNDRWDAFLRLLFYVFSWLRGPAMFIHNGQLVSRVGEDDNINPGVVIVDLRSAVVMEQEYPDLGEANDWQEQSVLEDESIEQRSEGLLRTMRLFNSAKKDYPVAYAVGPGIHFTKYGEKIRTTIDLRRQVRLAIGEPILDQEGKKIPQPGVKAFTRDGIEVGANCFVVFSLSDPPDVIPVAYWGGRESKHLHELELEREGSTVKIKNLHHLDPPDVDEIHRAVQSKQIYPIAPGGSLVDTNPGIYPFDKDRVFSAAYGQSYRISANDKNQWHELPLVITADIFRNLLEKYNFDYLFSADIPDILPWMDEFKPVFSRHVRHQGIMSYQLVRLAGLPPRQENYWNECLDGMPFNIKLGEKINLDVLEFSTAYPLTNSKPLRDRGISIVAAGFSEPKIPINIRERMAERWRARWDREIQILLARQDREAMQIISNARNRAQRDNAYFLSNLFKEEKYSSEALALLLFQSLELAATDLKSHKDMPPKEILAMLQNLHHWLLRERQDMDDRKKRHHDNHNKDNNLSQSSDGH